VPVVSFVSKHPELFAFEVNINFLAFSVCEGSLDLSVLVSIIRSHRNDYFRSYSVLQC